jgi:acetyltransferase-like isoleucine patch superfamily enzyme
MYLTDVFHKYYRLVWLRFKYPGLIFGKNSTFSPGFKIVHGYNTVKIGNHCNLVNTLINSGSKAKLIIKDYVFFGHGVQILVRGHDFNKKNRLRQITITEKPITIESGAWIASGAIILGGVTIGKHAVVAAGSVVTKNVPAKTIVAGNPARKIKKLLI